jgi:chemotaxis-related protein WspD
MNALQVRAANPALAGPEKGPQPNSGESEVYACWNEIGVHGDATCPELKRYIRCRNCPVYSSAGVKLLDRPLPPGYRQDWSEHFARTKELLAPSRASVVLFRISDEWMALPAQALKEVADQRSIHSLPHRRQGIILGLVNIRGELLVCISMGHLLHLDDLPPSDQLRRQYRRLLVADWDGKRIAFPVDEVRGIYRYQAQELKEPPNTLARSGLGYTQGVFHWEGNPVNLLGADRLFSCVDRSLT